jgi:hypothetical protein
MQVVFLGDGHIVRSEDSSETSSNHIHPSMCKTLKSDGRRIQLSLTSVRSLLLLRTALLEEIQKTTLTSVEQSDEVKQYDANIACFRENLRNWLSDTIGMVEMVQERIQVRLCVGYTLDCNGEHYDLTFLRADRSLRCLHISATSLASRLHLNFKLINFNIEHSVITESISGSIGEEVRKDDVYSLFVKELVDNRRILYETYERTKFMTNVSLSVDEFKRKIREAEENEDEKDMYWKLETCEN